MRSLVLALPLAVAVAVAVAINQSGHALAEGADALASMREAIARIDSAKNVTFSTIDIHEIEHWLVEFPNGTIARGGVVRFKENMHSAETLAGSLLAQERHATFVMAKKKTCDGLSGQLAELRGKINYESEHLRHSAMAGHSLSPARLEQLHSQQQQLHAVLQGELAHYSSMISDHKLITNPVSQRYGQFLDGYADAISILQAAKHDDLEELCLLLAPLADTDSGYAEAILYAFATIRAGRDTAKLNSLLIRHKEKLESSELLGFSPVNMSRIMLSITCESSEDFKKSIAYIKRNRDALKSPAITYTLGTWHESKDQWSEAVRYFRMARAKLKDDARNKAIASADVIYCQWRHGKFKALADNQEMVDEVRAYASAEPGKQLNDWQVCRGLAVVTLIDGDDKTALRHLQQAIACAPPRIQTSLRGLQPSFSSQARLEYPFVDLRAITYAYGMHPHLSIARNDSSRD